MFGRRLFRIGTGKEEYSVISDLLDIEKCDGKPQYLMSSHLPLVLYDCTFDEKDADFGQVGCDEVVLGTATTFHLLWRESNLAANVQRLFWKHSERRVTADKGTCALETAYRTMGQLRDTKKGKPRKQKKLMKMEREPSLKERLDSMKNSKLRKFGVKQQMREYYQEK